MRKNVTLVSLAIAFGFLFFLSDIVYIILSVIKSSLEENMLQIPLTIFLVLMIVNGVLSIIFVILAIALWKK